jgi:hypothetical protein
MTKSLIRSVPNQNAQHSSPQHGAAQIVPDPQETKSDHAQLIALGRLRGEMTKSSHPYWMVFKAIPKEGNQPWNANSGVNCTSG